MPKICEYCGKEFDVEEAHEDFEAETLKNCNYLTKCLCAECAIEAINAMDNGVYYGGGKGLVARRIQEGDGAAVYLHRIRADGLGNAACLAGGDARIADIV